MLKTKITFLMLAFNSEKFIKETVESVLSQSEKSIHLIIRNNASTDETEAICRDYAKKDSRITYCENKRPFITDDGKTMRHREWWPEIKSEYVAVIDHDDILDKEFAIKMYAAAEEFKADMVVCGNSFFDNDTKIINGHRFAPELHTEDISCIAKRINEYYGVLRTLWAKLYRSDFFDKYYEEVFNSPERLKISADTYATFCFLERCHSFVCIQDILYNYRVSSSSQFHSKIPELYRIDAADVLFEKAFEFLSKYNMQDSHSISFLYSVHWGHMQDLIQIVKRSDRMLTSEKLTFIQEILKNIRLQVYAESSISILLKTIFSFLNDILEQDGTEKEDLQEFYIYRFYRVMTRQVASDSIFQYYTMLSAVMDPENKHHLGISLLNRAWGFMSPGEEYFMQTDVKEKQRSFTDLSFLHNMLAGPAFLETCKRKEKKLMKAAEQENWELVAERVSEFNNIYPGNEHATYYRLYLACLLEQWEFAKEQAHIFKVLWSDSPDIMELCQFILEEAK